MMTEPDSKLWRRVRGYIAANQAAPARATLESILARNPDDTAAHVILGGLYAVADQQRAAAAQVVTAARNPPDDLGLLGDLIAALLACGEIVVARRLLGAPSIAASDSLHVLARAAGQRQLLGEHAEALVLTERAQSIGAAGREFHFQYAVLLAFNGRMDEARVELERCIALEPPLGRAYVQLARMHKQTDEANHLDAIEAALCRVKPDSEDHAALEFAHYKELEDLQRHDEAWHALIRGNAIAHARMPYRAAPEAARFDHLIHACSQEFLSTKPTLPDDGPQPIFVIGMPRSGTTVLERALGNHSQIESAGELGAFARTLAWGADHSAPVLFDDVILDRLDQIDWRELGKMYLAQTQWRAHGKPFYVDKLPRNWMLAGLIHKALPHAPILNLVRDPLDVCFSNWRAYFGPGPEYTYAYALDALAVHYGHYRKVMAHWRTAMPSAILDVEYSKLVREPESTMRMLLDYCRLDYEPGCIDLARNTSPSATLSMSQVRQPMHTRAFEEWLPYADKLAGLRAALAETVTT